MKQLYTTHVQTHISLAKRPIHKKIPFRNTNNPKAAFDIIRLEELIRRDDLDHATTELHRVEFFIILFVESGTGTHTIDFTEYPCEKGTLLTVRKDQLHKFSISEDIQASMFLFTDEFLVRYLESSENQKTMLLFNELLGVPKLQLKGAAFDTVFSIIQRIQKEYFKINDPYSLGIIRSELHILITQLFRIKAEQKNNNYERKYLSSFIEFQQLAEQNSTKSIKVQDYARDLGISTKTLNTITKSIVQKSAKAFLDEICTKQIKRLLINTDLSVNEVAYQSGFEETTNFYKYFKRQVGMTPEQFRASF